MAEPVFQRAANCPQLYFADCTSTTAFLLPAAEDNPPARLTLRQTWDRAGCYLFLAEDVAADGQQPLAVATWIYLADATRVNARFAWIANPNQPDAGLDVQFLALDGPRTDRVLTFGSPTLSLLIGQTCRAVLAEDAVTLTPPSRDHAAVLTADTRFDTPGPISLAFCGENNGSLRVGMALPSNNVVAGLSQMDVGIRLFYRDPLADSQIGARFLSSLRYPVFSEKQTDWRGLRNLNLTLTIDPLAPTTVERSFFTFIDPANPGDAPALPSCFRTNLGHTVYLTPVDAHSRLVFAPLPADSTGARTGHYLVPAGSFAVSVPRNANAAHEDNLLCGLSGLEYIKLPPDRPTHLTFVPGQPAYVPGFTPGAPTLDPVAGTSLSPLATTAWISVSHPSGPPPVYYTQPDSTVLHAVDGSTRSLDTTFLEYYEVPALVLAGDEAPIFPVLSFAGVDDTVLARQFEDQIAAPLRRSQLAQVDRSVRPPASGNVTVQATTPQGFLATIAEDGADWQQLTLAVDSTDTPLAFTGIGWDSDLRRALQANQLFLVISDPAAVRSFFTQNQLTVDGFTFDLNPDRWADHGTILLFKFHDKPITDLIAATDQWTLPDRFNVNPGQARSRLARLIHDALAKVPEDATQAANPQTVENYRNLADAARLPQWTGVLALNVSVGPEDLPPELQGLAAGIDETKFYAQYVGVELNQVRPDGLDLKMEQSAIFGLIDYQDDGPPPPNDSGYNFYVSRLNALFENARLKFFASDINVTVDRLFDERTALRSSPNGRNQIVLAGRREDHDGKPAYVFSFRGSNRFALPDSPILHEVEIVKAAFTTDPPAAPDGYVAGEAVRSRFQFWGRLNFRRLDDFDILSFGPDTADDDPTAPPSQTALSFSGLTLSMTFTWQSTAARSFVLDADALRFDLSQSRPRPGSLYAKFPLKLLTLTRGDTQTTPDTLGYMPVKTPIAARKPDGDWYALTFELDLGSVGALAGSAGIVVGVLAAWRPGEDGVYVGLRLPGSSGGKKEIALQGVLKIVFKRIEFVTVSGADVASTRYLLKLKNIVLKFMLLSIPPSGQSEIILFGDPSGGDTKTLGWYAAYAKSGPRRPEPNKLPKGLF